MQLDADPGLICHMETADPTTRWVSARTEAVDWQQLAVETMFWAADRGIPAPAGSSPPVTAQPGVDEHLRPSTAPKDTHPASLS